MSHSRKSKSIRRIAERVALDHPAPRVKWYSGARWWEIIIGLFWPPVLARSRKLAQDLTDIIHARAVKSAIKHTTRNSIKAKEAQKI